MVTDRWRSLLPHVLLWALVLGSGTLLGIVLWPVASALLLALAIAALVEPVLFRPCATLVGRWWPALDRAFRDWVVAAVATSLLGAGFLFAALVVLWALLGSFSSTLDAVVGVAMQDQVRITATAELAGQQVVDLAHLYGGQQLAAGPIVTFVQDLLTRTRVGTEFLVFLVAGTGGFAAKAALVLVTVFYLLCQGPALIAWVVRWLPLDAPALMVVETTYRTVSYHLLAHILGRALVLGAGLGLIAWGIGGLNGILVALAAALFGLLPLVGPLVAWMPLAGLVWSRGDPGLAVALGISGWVWCWVVGRLFNRVATRLGTDQLWLEFLVFLGLVGGLLAHGPAGLVIGPAAVLGAAVAVATVRLVYSPGESSGITAIPGSGPSAG